MLYYLTEVFEAILVFFILGGAPIALVSLILIWIGLKKNWLWFASSFSLTYLGIAIFWVNQTGRVPMNNAEQIYAMAFRWGLLFYVSILFMLALIIKLIFYKKT